jgi:hypothetical protein
LPAGVAEIKTVMLWVALKDNNSQHTNRWWPLLFARAPAEVKPGKKPADPAAHVSLPDTPTNPAGSPTARNGFATPDTAALTFPTATAAAVAAAAADVAAAILLQIKHAVACLTHPQTQSSAQT